MRILKLLPAAAFFFVTASHAAGVKSATVYKSPTCGCCKNYVSYLKKNGIRVTAINRENMDAIKTQHGIPKAMQSCHTTIIGGYAVEGHVPVAAINKLLEEKPKIRGIALPGMPADSPGMGQMRPGTLTVYEIAGTDAPRVFSVE